MDQSSWWLATPASLVLYVLIKDVVPRLVKLRTNSSGVNSGFCQKHTEMSVAIARLETLAQSTKDTLDDVRADIRELLKRK